jgi:hypothetical protein
LLIDDNKLYIASSGMNAITVVDVSDSKNPKFISKILHNEAKPLLE